MITNLLLNIVYFFGKFVISLFPTGSLPGDVSTNITLAGQYLANINQFFPATSVLAILAVTLSIEGGIFVYKIIKWVYQKIPFIK